MTMQGQIHGNPVADRWAGAVMRKPLGIQKCDGRTDGPTYRPTYRPTRQGVESATENIKKIYDCRNFDKFMCYKRAVMFTVSIMNIYTISKPQRVATEV